MDAIEQRGLNMIEDFYTAAANLIDYKMAPHELGMGTLCYQHKGSVIDMGTKGLHPRKDYGAGKYFSTRQIGDVVRYCQELGFTSGGVTKADLLRQQQKITECWSQLCQSLAPLGIPFTWNGGFLVIYSEHLGVRVNLVVQPDSSIMVQLCAINGVFVTTPQNAAAALGKAFNQ